MHIIYGLCYSVALALLVVIAVLATKAYDCEELREKCALTQLICNDKECIYLIGDCTNEERVVLRACEYSSKE